MKIRSSLTILIILSSFLIIDILSKSQELDVSGADTVEIQPGKLAFIIVMDGVRGDFFTKDNFPNVFDKLVPQGVLFTNGTAVSPAITTVNHVSLITGAFPNVTGAVATSTYNSTAYHEGKIQRVSFGSSTSIPSETLLTHADDVLTIMVVGKSKLANMKKGLDESKGSTYTVLPSRLHDVLIPDEGDGEKSVGVYDIDFPSDVRLQQNSWLINETMSQLLTHKDEILNGRDSLVVINLPSTDWAGHSYGAIPDAFHPTANIYQEMVKDTDFQIGRLITFLENNGLITTSNFFLTSDHGMHNIIPGSPRKITDTTATSFDVAMNSTFFSQWNKSYTQLYAVAAAENTLHLYLRFPEETVKTALEYLHKYAIASDFIGKPNLFSRLWLRDDYKSIVGNESLYTGLLSDMGINTYTAGDIVIEYAAAASPFGGFNPEFECEYDPGPPPRGGCGDHGVAEDTHIPMLMAGVGFKNNITEDRTAYITDIAPTIARLLGIKKPLESNGKVWEEYFQDEGVITEVHLESSFLDENKETEINIGYQTFGTGPYKVKYYVLDKEFSPILEGNESSLTGSGNVTFTWEGGKFDKSPFYVVGQVLNSSDVILDQAQDFFVIQSSSGFAIDPIWFLTFGILLVVIMLTIFMSKQIKKKQ